MSQKAIASEHPRHKGSEVLLQVLGGLVLAYVVGSANNFILFLQGGTRQEGWLFWLAVSAFGCYAINLFRQIHGMAIVLTDQQYVDEIGEPSTFENAVSFTGMLVVLAVPCALVSYINFTVSNFGPDRFWTGVGWFNGIPAFAGGVVNQTPVSPNNYPCGWVLNAYLFTALAYLLWDGVTFRKLWPLSTEPSAWKTAFKYLFISVLSALLGWVVACTFGPVAGVASGTSCAIIAGVLWMVVKRIKQGIATSFWAEIWKAIQFQNSYKYWVLNWMLLLVAVVGVGLVFWLIAAFPSFGAINDDGKAGKLWFRAIKNPHAFVPLVLTIIAGFYTLIDYVINAKFYFSPLWKNSGSQPVVSVATPVHSSSPPPSPTTLTSKQALGFSWLARVSSSWRTLTT